MKSVNPPSVLNCVSVMLLGAATWGPLALASIDPTITQAPVPRDDTPFNRRDNGDEIGYYSNSDGEWDVRLCKGNFKLEVKDGIGHCCEPDKECGRVTKCEGRSVIFEGGSKSACDASFSCDTRTVFKSKDETDGSFVMPTCVFTEGEPPEGMTLYRDISAFVTETDAPENLNDDDDDDEGGDECEEDAASQLQRGSMIASLGVPVCFGVMHAFQFI